MFDLEDASNDGTIDAEEFSIVCSSYGLNKSECQEAFRKMSKVSIPTSALNWKWINSNIPLTHQQGAVEVTREEFAELWREYFSSDDPAAAGNFIFGKTSF